MKNVNTSFNFLSIALPQKFTFWSTSCLFLIPVFAYKYGIPATVFKIAIIERNDKNGCTL